MAAPPYNFYFPHFPPPSPPAAKPPSHPIPPPPHHTVAPPPPHIIPPPPPSSPNNHSTVIVIVFVSFGGLLFLAFLAIALCCFLKRRKKKRCPKTDITRADNHLKIQERVVKRPDGSEVVDLLIKDDVHFGEKKREKEEKLREVGVGENIHNTLEDGVSTSGSSHHHLQHKKPYLEHDPRSQFNF